MSSFDFFGERLWLPGGSRLKGGVLDRMFEELTMSECTLLDTINSNSRKNTKEIEILDKI